MTNMGKWAKIQGKYEQIGKNAGRQIWVNGRKCRKIDMGKWAKIQRRM